MRCIRLVEYNFLIGRKGTLVYVGAIISKANPDKDTILINARGKLMNKAIDVALILIAKIKNFKIKNVEIKPNKQISKQNKQFHLGSIEIKIGG